MSDQVERKDEDDQSEVGVKRARAVLSDLVLRAGYGNERIGLTRRGKKVAYLIGPKDFERLRALDAA